MLNWFSSRFHFRYRKIYFYKYIDRIIIWRGIFHFLIILKIPTKWIKIAVVLRNFKVNNALSEEKHASRYFTLFRWLSLLNFRKIPTSYRTSGFVLAHGVTIRRRTCLDVVRIVTNASKHPRKNKFGQIKFYRQVNRVGTELVLHARVEKTFV